MGLFVSTTGTDVPIPELGITISHPTTDLDLGARFNSDDIKNAGSLTTAITGGVLAWRKVAAGTVQAAADYDPDFLELENEAAGGGYLNRGLRFLDLQNSIVQATANANLALNVDSARTLFFTGSTAGQIVTLPNATTLGVGHWFRIINLSTATISIRDFGNNVLLTLQALSQTSVFLYVDGTANGNWTFTFDLGSGNSFGTQLQFASSDAETSNNSQVTWLNKVTLNTPASLPLGDYLFNFQFLWRSANANRSMNVRIQQDGVDLINWAPFLNNVAENPLVSGFRRIPSISGAHTFTLDFRVGPAASTTVFMRDCRAFLWRVI